MFCLSVTSWTNNGAPIALVIRQRATADLRTHWPSGIGIYVKVTQFVPYEIKKKLLVLIL